MSKELKFYTISMGCDPEFFFSKKGKITGAEKIIPAEGVIYDKNKDKKIGRYDGECTAHGTISKIIIDGVQAELNPRPNTCRANLANEIGECFRQLYAKIKDDTSLNIDFSQVVKVSKKELDSLSEKSKTFGCAPSNNVYTQAESKITVNPQVYRYRSAGGHIHLGEYYSVSYPEVKEALTKPERLVPLLDILVGNTSVLIDRNPWAKERRKVYGRAGEYRLPAHGLEYRTLSNFWLQSYQLMSLVFGLARVSVIIVANSLKLNEPFDEQIIKSVNKEDIEKAINNNDYELAYKNFLKIRDIYFNLIKTDTYSEDYSYSINSHTVKEFEYFLSRDINYWFKEDPLTHWMKLPEGHGTGWETFLKTTVRKEMKQKKEQALMIIPQKKEEVKNG
jgi:hypothetical protein